MRRYVLGSAVAGAGVVVMLTLAARAPGQTAPAPTSGTGSLARYVPAKGLAVLLECSGLDSQATAWRNTAAYQILNTTSTGAMLEDALAQAVDKAPGETPKGALTGADVVALVKHVAQNGLILGMASREDEPDKLRTVIVLRGAYRKDIRPVTAKLLGARMGRDAKASGVTKAAGTKIVIVTPAAPPAPAARPTTPAGVPAPTTAPVAALAKPPTPWAFWVEKEDLVIAPDAEDVDTLLAVRDGKQRNAVDHPICAELLKADGAFQPVLAGFLDPSALPRTGPNPPAQAFEKAGVKRVDVRWGFEGPALMTVLRLAAPAPRTFPLTLADQPTFDLETIPPVPESTTRFVVFSLDAAKIYERAVAAAKQAGPDAAAKLEEFEKQIQARTQRRLREDLLAQLGPKVAYYTLPSKAKPGGLAGMMGMLTLLQTPRFVLEVDVKDVAKFRPMLDELMLAANKELEARFGGAAADTKPAKKADTKKSQPPTPPRFQVVPTDPPKYILRLPPKYAAMTNLNLTIALGKKHLVLAAAADAANEALALETRAEGLWKPEGDQAHVLGRLPRGLTFLQISDPGATLPEALAALPAMLQATMSSLASGPGRMAPASGSPATSEPTGGPPYGSGPPPNGASMPGGVAGGASGVIEIDPAKVPIPEEIRPLVFPGSSALAVDARGLQFVSRGAFPGVPTPGNAGIMSAILLPALRKAREAARGAAGPAAAIAPAAARP